MCVTAAADESTLKKAHAPSSSTPEQPCGERQRRSSDASDRDSGTVARLGVWEGRVLGFNKLKHSRRRSV